jgi:hypothetical protein
MRALSLAHRTRRGGTAMLRVFAGHGIFATALYSGLTDIR